MIPSSEPVVTEQESLGGHRVLCVFCGKAQVHRARYESEDNSVISVTCLTCGESQRFVSKAGAYVAEPIVKTLDRWTDDKFEAALKELLNPQKPSEAPVKPSRLAFLHRSKKSEVPNEPKEVEAEPKDEFADVDLSTIKTFGDAIKVTGDFDKAATLLTRAAKQRGRK